MKREIFQEIAIPEGIEIEIEGNSAIIKGKLGEIKKRFGFKNIKLEKKEGKIFIGKKNATKNEKRLINTATAHIKNMILGVKEGFEYKLKVVYSHFPITVELHGKEVLVKNFLGEKVPRKTEILPEVEVKIDKDFITVKSHDKESAGQTAANLERATRIANRDRRVFQDGIFLINKAGKEI